MRSFTIDIINEKALNLLRNLEQLKLIRIRKNSKASKGSSVDWKKFKGSMSRQEKQEVDAQLKELRNEWD